MKYRTLCPAWTAAMPRATRTWLLPVPGGPTRHRFSFARDPFQGGEVVQGRAGDGARGPVQLLECLDDGERRGLHPGRGVGGVAGGDLGVDQGPQQLLGRPPLGLRGDQQLGGELADGGQLEPPQPGGDVGRQRRRRRAHRCPPVRAKRCWAAWRVALQDRCDGAPRVPGLPGRLDGVPQRRAGLLAGVAGGGDLEQGVRVGQPRGRGALAERWSAAGRRARTARPARSRRRPGPGSPGGRRRSGTPGPARTSRGSLTSGACRSAGWMAC